MTVSPLPRDGATLSGRDRAGRTLRIARHPELSRVVLSIWQDGRCQATIRLGPDEVVSLLAELVRALPAEEAGGSRSLAG